ncbi:MAG: hypothetical protein R6X10_08120 [Desulfobacterales bacterium]
MFQGGNNSLRGRFILPGAGYQTAFHCSASLRYVESVEPEWIVTLVFDRIFDYRFLLVAARSCVAVSMDGDFLYR